MLKCLFVATYSLHLVDTFLPHRCRFLNVGRQSMDALTAKLRTLCGRSYMTLLHVRSSCSSDINSRNFPWRSSVSIFFCTCCLKFFADYPFYIFLECFPFSIRGIFRSSLYYFRCSHISIWLSLVGFFPGGGGGGHSTFKWTGGCRWGLKTWPCRKSLGAQKHTLS